MPLRPATAARVPPSSCCVCLDAISAAPAWEASGLLLCERCCSGAHSLLRTADASSIAAIWGGDATSLAKSWDRVLDDPDAPQTAADLARAYAEMRLTSDAIVEAIAYVRGDETAWTTVISILLGEQLRDPAFTSALRN